MRTYGGLSLVVQAAQNDDNRLKGLVARYLHKEVA